MPCPCVASAADTDVSVLPQEDAHNVYYSASTLNAQNGGFGEPAVCASPAATSTPPLPHGSTKVEAPEPARTPQSHESTKVGPPVCPHDCSRYPASLNSSSLVNLGLIPHIPEWITNWSCPVLAELQMSSSVVECPKLGRRIRAHRKIKLGEQIFLENPLVLASAAGLASMCPPTEQTHFGDLALAKASEFCIGCGRSFSLLKQGLEKCDSCPGHPYGWGYYCSERCMDLYEARHLFECRFWDASASHRGPGSDTRRGVRSGEAPSGCEEGGPSGWEEWRSPGSESQI